MCCITFICLKSGGEPGFSLVGHHARGEGGHHPAVLLVLAPGKGRLDNLNSLPDCYLSSQFGAFLMG